MEYIQIKGLIEAKELSDYIINLDEEALGYYETKDYGSLETYLDKEYKRLKTGENLHNFWGSFYGICSIFGGAMTAGGDTLSHYIIGGLIALIGVITLIYYYRRFERSYLNKNGEAFQDNLSTFIKSLQ